MCSFELDKPTNEVAHELDMRRGEETTCYCLASVASSTHCAMMRCDAMRFGAVRCAFCVQ